MRNLPKTLWLGALLVGVPNAAHAATASPLQWAFAVLVAVVAVFWLGWALGGRHGVRVNKLLPDAMASDQRLMWALWGSGDSFWIWEVSEDLLSWASATPMLGFSSQVTMKGKEWRERIIHRDDRERVEAAISSHTSGSGDEQYEVEYRLRDTNGDWNWVRARGRVVAADSAGQPSLVAGTFRVIERERAQDAQRRISAEVIKHMLEGVCITDLTFHFVSANPAFLRLTGYTAEELTGQSASLLDSPQHQSNFFRDVREQLQQAWALVGRNVATASFWR